MIRLVIIFSFIFTLSSGVHVCAQSDRPVNYIAEKRARVSQGRIEIDYGSLYYEELGTGEPVILIHEHSLSHLMWDEQFYELSESYRIIRYDLHGYGDSSPQLEYIQFMHMEDLITLMDALSIEKTHIIGSGMGGSVAADMLVWHPERVKSAILVSGNLQKTPGPSQSIPAGAVKRDLKMVKYQESDKEKQRQKRLNELLKTAGSQREKIREPLTEMIRVWDVWQPFHKEARVIGGLDTVEALKEKRSHLPVLIVEGKSKGNSSSAAPEILNYLSSGKIILLNDCGRMLNMEQPERFNQIVHDFIGSVARENSSF